MFNIHHRKLIPIAAAFLALLLQTAPAQPVPPAPQTPSPSASSELGTTVHTEGGLISGSGTTLHIFKGIPFAAPPVGDLRWRPPQPAAPWSGVRDATEFGPDPMQKPDSRLRAKSMSEDCLYLNVWTPAKRTDDKLPVMVFIFGGAFDHGSGSRTDFDGEKLARKGVVFVNLNYRVGIFGFLCHPLLTAESEHKASGDYAMLDQIAALRWVHNNIASFGGDPNRVMIFGQSAGGSSINLMLLSPLAKGLFQAAASESPGEMRALSSVQEAEKFGLSLGNDLPAMRTLPAATLLEKNKDFSAMRQKDDPTSPRPLWPVIDGWVLPMSESAAYATGHVNIVPLIIGNNAGESVTEFAFGVRAVAADMSRINPSVYRYYFMRHKGDGPTVPPHVAELFYVFGDLDTPPPAGTPAYNAVDRQLSETMMAYWIQLATTGSPNKPGLPTWPAYNTSTDLYLQLDKPIQAAPDERKDQLEKLRLTYEQGMAARSANPPVAGH